jgi:hypothetical protein
MFSNVVISRESVKFFYANTGKAALLRPQITSMYETDIVPQLQVPLSLPIETFRFQLNSIENIPYICTFNIIF